MKGTKKRRRGTRGLGRLYKRDKSGKDLRADSRAHAPFWLAYSINGKRKRVALKDRAGQPIYERAAAEKERLRILGPMLQRERADRLRAVQEAVQSAEQDFSVSLDRAADPLPVADLWTAYAESVRRRRASEATMRGYRSQVERLARWSAARGIALAKDIGPDRAADYIRELEAAFSPSTFNQHIQTLRRTWAALADEIRADGNPWENVELLPGERVQRRRKAFSLDEATAVLNVCPPDLRDLLTVIALTGQRLVDVVKLKESQCDFAANVIELIPEKLRRRKPEPVLIPMLPQVRRLLQSRKPRKGLYFYEIAREYDRDRSAITKRITSAIQSAGFETSAPSDSGRAVVQYGAHSFRHTFNTVARLAGLPDAMIKKITGHATDRLTDHYTQFDRSHVSALAGQMEKLGGGLLPSAARAPLPPWAVELIDGMTGKNWKAVKAELLKGGRS